MYTNDATKNCPYDSSTVPMDTELPAKPPKIQRAYLDNIYATVNDHLLENADVRKN